MTQFGVKAECGVVKFLNAEVVETKDLYSYWPLEFVNVCTDMAVITITHIQEISMRTVDLHLFVTFCLSF